MKYRLKDRELQAKLDEISGGDFSELLGGVEDTGFSALRIPLCGFIEDAGQTIPRVGVYVRRQDVEEIPEYDPHSWNELSDVRPTELGVYRVEVFANADESEPTRLAGYWDGKRFLIPQEGGRTRFRPWEDEE